MRLGNIALPVGAGLSPMAGVTDAAMRLLCGEQGAAWSVSEMLSAKGWIYSQGKNREARELLTRLPGEGVGGLQLFGREPELMAEAARLLGGAGFEFFDLNFGCPAPKITGNGEGSALMREPELIGRIVRAVADAADRPVTVKIRAGWNRMEINAVEVAKICEQAGAAAIAVHGRTRAQQYAGQADWNVIRAVKRGVSVPVIGNGDVRGGADALRMMEETDCDGVLVGRAAQGNPWIFKQILYKLETGKDLPKPSIQEVADMVLRHAKMQLEVKGEYIGIREIRKHAAWYTSGYKNSSKLRGKINEVESYEDLETLFKNLIM